MVNVVGYNRSTVSMVELFWGRNVVSCDTAVNWQFGFQDPATPIMEGIVKFHHDLMVILVAVVVLVAWMMLQAVRRWNENVEGSPSDSIHGSTLEVVWTLVPARILLAVALPSFSLLYSMEEVVVPMMTLKVIGHQWYWEYQYGDWRNADDEMVEFEAYMLPEDELEVGDLRMLSVDNPVVLPVAEHIRVLVTSADVLHCWAVPSLAIKVDACPGRLNQLSLYINRAGEFAGQCSEICGQAHGMMPIIVQAVSVESFMDWVAGELGGERIGLDLEPVA